MSDNVNKARRQYADLVEQRRKIEKATGTAPPKETLAQHAQGFLIMAIVGRGIRNIFGGGR